MAYLYGEGNKKIFVGFQIQAYYDYKNGFDLEMTKEDIKEKVSKLLITSEFFLGIKIVEFHYFIVGLYIEEDLNDIYKQYNYDEFRNYSDSLKEYCIKNDLEIIFYDPINKKFYGSSKKYIYKRKKFDNNEYQTNLNSFKNILKSRLKIKGIRFLEKVSFKDLGNILPIPNVNTFNIFFKKDQITVENNFKNLENFIIIMNKDGKYFKDEMIEEEVREMKIDNWLKEFTDINSDLDFYRFEF